MLNQSDLKEAIDTAADRLIDLLPDLERAQKAYLDLEMRRGELEDTINGLQDRLLAEFGDEYKGVNDQLLRDFSLEKHGKDFVLLKQPKHGQMYIEGACKVQCPDCNEYNIELHYLRRRYADTDGRRPISKVQTQNGAVVFRGLYYCERCARKGAME